MKKLFLALVALYSLVAQAQIAERPQPQRLYNNLSREFPEFLNQQEAAQLEEKLEAFSNETSNQICVVVVDDLNGYDAAEYATKVGNEWGVGKKDKNNGIVILIKPTQSDGGRDLFIAVGYGLEGAIPDLATKRIRDEQITPNLKSGNYYAALDQGTDVLMKLAKGEINVKDYTRQRHGSGRGGLGTFFIIAIIVIVLLINIFRGGGGGRGYTYGRAGRSIFWGTGGFGSFGGGGSWGGGSSGGGGGWGGFGGGGFGGGGSGGKW